MKDKIKIDEWPLIRQNAKVFYSRPYYVLKKLPKDKTFLCFLNPDGGARYFVGKRIDGNRIEFLDQYDEFTIAKRSVKCPKN